MNMEKSEMKRIRHFSQKLALCVLLACSLAVNASAEKSVSVFAATDRHAQYETVAVETEETEAAQETPQPGSPEKEPPRRPRSAPVYDATGSLIWHNHLTDVLTLVRQDRDAVQPDIVLLGGDNIGEGSDSSKDETGYPMGAPPFSMKSVDAQIAHVFGDAARGLYTYGSHDKNEMGNYTDVFFSGPVPCDGYYLYGISFAQMIYDSDWQVRAEDERGRAYSGKDLADPNGISAQTASHLFLSWVNSLDDHWPIIVMSHVPLHAKRGDNSGAWTWARALNEAAENHDVIFLWGHNHTLERGEEEQAAEHANYLLLPGDEITVQSWAPDAEGKPVLRKAIPSEAPVAGDAEVKEKPKYELITEKETLKFVYMNAGYITNGVGSLLTFTDMEEDGAWDRLTVKRYSLGSDAPEEWDLPLRQWNQQR